jgi:hypothetical protein
MTLRPQPLPPVPEATVVAVQAAFPKGNLYVDLRAEFGTLYDDQLFADLYPPSGRPVEVAPWRLALIVVMQYIEGLTDCQAADAVRRCMDWQYASLNVSLRHEVARLIVWHAFVPRPVVPLAVSYADVRGGNDLYRACGHGTHSH